MYSIKKRTFSLIFALLFTAGATVASAAPRQAEKAVTADAEASSVQTVIPSGKSIGVILNTDGVMVADVSDFEEVGGESVSPSKNAGIIAGDLITELDGRRIKSVSELNEAVERSQGAKVNAKVVRDGKKIELLIKPKMAKEDGKYRIGAWIKDAASGIGTMTFYDPQSGGFAALGHGICSVETGKPISVDSGSILASTIVSVRKGERGVPGELKGVFGEGREVLGKISKNCECGIYGKCLSVPKDGELMPVASKKEVHSGTAHILADVEGSSVCGYDIEILKVMPQSGESSKGMIIKICDDELISKTGGIVQGMSGSPIIQDGRLVGAVTHVFVNDPTRGYGIFADIMLDKLADMS